VNYVIDSMRVDHVEQSISQDGAGLCMEDVEEAGECELRAGRWEAAQAQFRKALALAPNPMERHFLEGRITDCVYATMK
jgi:hypothetical protein